MDRPNKHRLTAAAAFALLAGAVGVGGPGLVPPAQAASTPKFGHQAIIDFQRSGFEPDIIVDSKGKIYSSVPNGSSQGESFVWKSVDHGDSFQLVPGNVAFGKPTTCVGGGDTELAKDSGDNLYLSDLQNLTNLSNSISKDGGMTWNASCTSAPNTPVDRMWFAVHGKLGDPDFAIYEEYDAVLSGANPASPVGNQLVETVSHDGVNFLPVINANPGPACLGGGAVNCVTNEESLPGNQVLNNKGELVIAHGGQDGRSVWVSVGKPITAGGVTTATWKDVRVNGDICPDMSSSSPGICGITNFPTIAIDRSGNLYVVNAAQQIIGGNPRGPYHVYVNTSRDGGHTWSKSLKVSRSGSNAFPWITAGTSGRVGVAWYHANKEGESGDYTFDGLKHAQFDVEVAQSMDALSATPHYNVVTATEHPMKYGPICTAGTACAATMGDRSLGDYLNIGIDDEGALAVVYVDDSSNSYTVGPLGDVAENGPPVIQKQITGPSMIAGKTIKRTAFPFDKVKDPSNDAYYNMHSMRTLGSTNLDLTDAAVVEEPGGVQITMKVRSLESTAVSPTLGGTTGEWITRFTTFNAGTPGNGHIYYAGMEIVSSGTPRFFVGDVGQPTAAVGGANVQISMAFDSTKTVPGTMSGNGLVTLHVPYSAVPGLKKGQLMYSVTAFTATTVGTLGGSPLGLFNLIDATPPFDHIAGSKGVPTTVRPVQRPVGVTPSAAGGSLAATGGLGAPAAAALLLSSGCGLLLVRRRLT